MRADGMQLADITRLVEKKGIIPQIDPHGFELSRINDAVKLVAAGHTNGKVIVSVS